MGRCAEAFCCVVVFALLAPRALTAQETMAQDTSAAETSAAETMPQSRESDELAVFWTASLTTAPSTENLSTTTFSPSFGAEYRWSSGWALEASWGFSVGTVVPEGRDRALGVDPANLLLGGSYSASISETVDGQLKLLVGAPLASTEGGTIPDNRLTEFNLSAAASARGFRDPFLWGLDVVPIVARGGLEVRPIPWLEVRPHLALAPLVSVNERPSRFGMSTAFEVGTLGGVVDGRIGWSYFFTSLGLENNDEDQHAIYAGFDVLLDSDRLSFDLHLNLDGPYGVMADAVKPTWGVMIGSSHVF